MEKKQYVWKYLVKEKFHGYHVSTFCQVTKDLIDAKLYRTGSEEQKAIIIGNLTTVFNATTGFLADTQAQTRKIYWKDVKLEDVSIKAIEISEGALRVFEMKERI